MKPIDRDALATAMKKVEPREYRLEVLMPRELSAQLEKLVQSFRDKGVKATKSKVAVIIMKQFFDSLPEE